MDDCGHRRRQIKVTNLMGKEQNASAMFLCYVAGPCLLWKRRWLAGYKNVLSNSEEKAGWLLLLLLLLLFFFFSENNILSLDAQRPS